MSNVLGVGIDLVSISEIQNLDERLNGNFARQTFTDRELKDADSSLDYYQFLAGRFAVKEAVYKAICGNYPEIDFDFRNVETIRISNGAPRFNGNDHILKILSQIGASDIKISISNQGDLVTAIAELIK